jgi:hypothetical protein
VPDDEDDEDETDVAVRAENVVDGSGGGAVDGGDGCKNGDAGSGGGEARAPNDGDERTLLHVDVDDDTTVVLPAAVVDDEVGDDCGT